MASRIYSYRQPQTLGWSLRVMVTPNRGFLPHQEYVREVAVRIGRCPLAARSGCHRGTKALCLRSLRRTRDGAVIGERLTSFTGQGWIWLHSDDGRPLNLHIVQGQRWTGEGAADFIAAESQQRRLHCHGRSTRRDVPSRPRQCPGESSLYADGSDPRTNGARSTWPPLRRYAGDVITGSTVSIRQDEAGLTGTAGIAAHLHNRASP